MRQVVSDLSLSLSPHHLDRGCGFLLYLLFFFIQTLGGCVERDATPSLIITEVSPERIQPGSRVVIKGRGFGEEASTVAISARALVIEQWSAAKIIAQVPVDIPGGERFLVVSRSGQQTPPFPVFVVGELETRPRGGRPEVGVTLDIDVPDFTLSDMSVDMTIPDQNMGGQELFALDDPEAEVVIEAELRDQQGVEELWIKVVARDPSSLGGSSGWGDDPLWGAAAQLDFPVDRLNFIRMELPDGPRAAALRGEVDGRIYWYHGDFSVPADASRFTLMTLRFERLNPQDRAPIRLSFVSRHSALRGVKNQRLPGRWSAGEVQFERRGDAP
jgi:hypothetical protein